MQVTLLGDFSSLMGAMTFAAYLTIGPRMRSWMPLWLHLGPVNATVELVLIMCPERAHDSSEVVLTARLLVCR